MEIITDIFENRTLLGAYHYLNDEVADPRTKDWFLLTNPIYPIGIIATYLYTVFRIIPKYMENKPAYDLKKLIIVYNLYQILSCSYITYGMIKSGWTTYYDFFCQPVDRSHKPEALRMANLCWWLLQVKISEFIETAIFAFRKKHNQISFLHVYHHILTFLFGWGGTKYFPGGSYTFAPILNNSVHVIMYTYYMLSLIKVDWFQRGMLKFKPYLTIFQMVQLVTLVLYAAQGTRSSCALSFAFRWFFTPNVALLVYLFYVFYQNSFGTKKKINKE